MNVVKPNDDDKRLDRGLGPSEDGASPEAVGDADLALSGEGAEVVAATRAVVENDPAEEFVRARGRAVRILEEMEGTPEKVIGEAVASFFSDLRKAGIEVPFTDQLPLIGMKNAGDIAAAKRALLAFRIEGIEVEAVEAATTVVAAQKSAQELAFEAKQQKLFAAPSAQPSLDVKNLPGYRELTLAEEGKLLATLKTRFDENPEIHEGVDWVDVEKSLQASPEMLWSLQRMEEEGQEPKVFMSDDDNFYFGSCYQPSDNTRVNMVYNSAAEARKQDKLDRDRFKDPRGVVNGNAVDIAASMGGVLMTKEQLAHLVENGDFTSDMPWQCWVESSHLPIVIKKNIFDEEYDASEVLIGRVRDGKLILDLQSPSYTDVFHVVRVVIPVPKFTGGELPERERHTEVASEVQEESREVSVEDPRIAHLKTDFDKGLKVVSPDGEAVDSDITWEQVVARLNEDHHINSEKKGWELAVAMRGKGELFGVDAEGRLLIKDRGKGSLIMYLEGKSADGDMEQHMYGDRIDEARARNGRYGTRLNMRNQRRYLDYKEMYELLCGAEDAPTGYSLFPFSRDEQGRAVESSELIVAQQFSDEGIAPYGVTIRLDNGRGPDGEITILHSNTIMSQNAEARREDTGAVRLLRV